MLKNVSVSLCGLCIGALDASFFKCVYDSIDGQCYESNLFVSHLLSDRDIEVFICHSELVYFSCDFISFQ